MADDEVKIVRLQLDIQQVAYSHVARVFPVGGDAQTGQQVLSIPSQLLELPGMKDAFIGMVGQIATRMGAQMGQEGDKTAVSLPPEDVPPGDGALGDIEFEVQVGELDGKLCAFLASVDGVRNPDPAGHDALVAVALAFVGDEGVQNAFHALVQAIGIALVRTQVKERREHGAPGTH